MPTGYTYGVQEGKVTTLEDYVKSCARAFLWQARESNEPDLIKLVQNAESDYHKKEYDVALKTLELLNLYTEKDWENLHKIELDQENKREKEHNDKMQNELARYQDMRAKVEAWSPPTPKHVEIKKFMIEQLDKSIEFDQYDFHRRIPFDLEEFKRDTLTAANRDVEYHREEMKKEEDRSGEWLEWVTQLLDSVKGK